MFKKFKLFLAIYIPVFVIAGVLFRNKPEILYPVGYTFAGITIITIALIVRAMRK